MKRLTDFTELEEHFCKTEIPVTAICVLGCVKTPLFAPRHGLFIGLLFLCVDGASPKANYIAIKIVR